MTNYTKATDFAIKDSLLTGNPLKLVKGTEINTEFAAIQAADATSVKSGEALGTPSSGTLTNCTGLPVSTGVSGLGTSVAAFLATPSSANLIAALTDETGTGAAVFANTPTLVTPILGTPTSGTLTNCTGLPAAGVTGTALVAAAIGTTVQAYDADLTTWAGVTPGTGVATALAVNVGTAGAVVVNGGALGTPSSGTATNLTGTAAGLTAGNVTTNANLTGHVTSVGNAAVLGSFTLSQLNTAVSDADIARTDAANTFTGVQSMTSPDVTTSITTASTTFTALAGATTLLTIGGTGASSVFAIPGTLEQSATTGALTVAGGVYIAKKLNVAGVATLATGAVLGTPASVTLTNATGLPASGVTGTALVSAAIGTTVQAYDADLTTWAGITPGTNVGTALAVNVGTSGAFVINGGALGTPSSGTATNLSGTAASLTAGAATLAASTSALKSATTDVNVASATAPSSGQVLTATSSTAATWQTPSTGGGATLTVDNKTALYSVVVGDLGKVIRTTSGTGDITLPSCATVGVGFNFYYVNATAAVRSINVVGSDAFGGADTVFYVAPGQTYQFVVVVASASGIWTCLQTGVYGSGGLSTALGQYATASGATSIAVGPISTASGSNSIAIGKKATASGTGALALGTNSSGSDSITASANYSTAIGSNSGNTGSQAVTGAGAMALGGSYASGVDSFAAAIGNNTSTYGAQGANSVAIGYHAKAFNANSLAIGWSAVTSNTDTTSIGNGTSASGLNAVAVGKDVTAQGSGSLAIGNGGQASGVYSASIGRQCSATYDYSFALGAGGSANAIGKFAYAATDSGSIDNGSVQLGMLSPYRDTTDATPSVLTSNGGGAGSTNQVLLPNNSAYVFDGIIVARQKAANGTASAAWKVEGLIRREANAAATTLVASTVTAISNAPGWTLALTADTTNGGLKVTFTGAAATNIRTVATIRTSEVTYA